MNCEGRSLRPLRPVQLSKFRVWALRHAEVACGFHSHLQFNDDHNFCRTWGTVLSNCVRKVSEGVPSISRSRNDLEACKPTNYAMRTTRHCFLRSPHKPDIPSNPQFDFTERATYLVMTVAQLPSLFEIFRSIRKTCRPSLS